MIAISKAVDILKAGGLVAFPTETVYGLGADASNPEAVRKIFLAKERPYDHPLIVHIAELEQLYDWALDVSPQALTLAQAFWPGPLTLILKKQAHVLDAVTGNQETVGLRVPSHPIAQELLQAFGAGVAAPSANKFTHISPTTSAAVEEELSGRVDLILEGDACEVGLESTIVDVSGEEPVILRPGMINQQMLQDVLGVEVKLRCQDTPVRTAGMHHLHYAPTTRTVLVRSGELQAQVDVLGENELPVVVVSHSGQVIEGCDQVHMPKEAKAYAHDLYQTLRELDHQGYQRIMIEAVPEADDWLAIRDRIGKASSAGRE